MHARSSSFYPIVLLCGVILFLSLGQRHAFGLYLVPVTQEWGWGRETFSIAIALQNLVWGLAQPFAGMLSDRWGPKRVLMLGGVCYALGLWLMPLSPDPLLFTLTAGVLVGLGLSGTAFGIVYSTVGQSVAPQDRALGLGLLGAVGGVGQLLMLPANLHLIDALGWSSALAGMSLVMLLVGPLSRFLPLPPRPATPVGELGLRQTLGLAFSDRDFWLLGIGFLSCGFQLAFIGTHLPAYLADHRLAPGVATLALGLIALTNVAGTYLFGVWGGRYRKKNLAALLYAGRTAAILAFIALPVSAASVYGFAAVMGFLWLATVPLTTGLLGHLYGLRYMSTLFGFVFLSHQVGSFLGVWLGGWMFDHLGSYTGVWLLAATLSALSAAVHLPVRERLEPAPQPA